MNLCGLLGFGLDLSHFFSLRVALLSLLGFGMDLSQLFSLGVALFGLGVEFSILSCFGVDLSSGISFGMDFCPACWVLD